MRRSMDRPSDGTLSRNEGVEIAEAINLEDLRMDLMWTDIE